LEQIILIIHLLIAIALVAVVLLQRSEGGGLGMGGGGGAGGMGGMMSVRGSANLLTRVTTILAACFMGTSLLLAILSGSHSEPGGIVEETGRTVPGEAPAGEAPGGAGDSTPPAPEEQPLSR
jgi:preprotein translocase subunit SecG